MGSRSRTRPPATRPRADVWRPAAQARTLADLRRVQPATAADLASSARDALAAVGLADRAGRTFGELSGGQRQRVLVARALVQDAAVLLLDEPFAGLDTASADALEALFADLADEGRALLIATHDVGQARRWDQVLCLNGRQVAFGAPEPTLTADTLEATYGGELVRLPEGGVLLPPHHDC